MKIMKKNRIPVKMSMAPRFCKVDERSLIAGSRHASSGGPLVTDCVK